jgi:hypothetical protein
MDEFARSPREERRLYFEQAAARLGLSAQIVEKDFWVCWSLKRLFELDEFRNHLTFKGGTTLSKVYRIIERFSEDIDVAIERDLLGFGGLNSPEEGKTGKQQQRRIDRLKTTCQAVIADRLMPQLDAAITATLGGNADWRLVLDSTDPDRQTLLFTYPAAIRGELSPYFSTSVKIELGARSDHFPVEQALIAPYVADAFPDAMDHPQTSVRVLTAVRTFWEKATILHVLHHQPEGKRVGPRMSRHYYDIYQLSRNPVLEQALNCLDLLDRVAMFKTVFFKTGWAKYEEARTGRLRLSPPKRLEDELRRDYQDMRPMFFREPPTFAQILAELPDLENRINAKKFEEARRASEAGR